MSSARAWESLADLIAAGCTDRTAVFRVHHDRPTVASTRTAWRLLALLAGHLFGVSTPLCASAAGGDIVLALDQG